MKGLHWLTLALALSVMLAPASMACSSEPQEPAQDTGTAQQAEQGEDEQTSGDDGSEEASTGGSEEDSGHTAAVLAQADDIAPVDGAARIVLNVAEGKQWGYEPKFIEVQQGERVQLVLVNNGRAEHDLELTELPAEHLETQGEAAHGGEANEEGRHSEAEEGHEHGEDGAGHHASGVVFAHAQPGTTAGVLFTPTKPGVYEFACTLPGHKEAGMVGKILVTPTEAAATASTGGSGEEAGGHHHGLHVEMDDVGHWHVFSSKTLTFSVVDDHGEGKAGLSPVLTYRRVGSDHVGKRTLDDGEITDNGDGTYSVEYAPSSTGAYAFTLQVEDDANTYSGAWPVEVVWDGEEGIKKSVNGTDYVYQIRYEWKPGHVHASDTEEVKLVFDLMRGIEEGSDINWDRPWRNRFDYLSSLAATVTIESDGVSESIPAVYKGKGIYEASRAFPPDEVGHDGREYGVSISFTDPYNGAEVQNGEAFHLQAVPAH